MDDKQKELLREQAKVYFFMAMMFIIVMTVIFLIGSGREVPEMLAVPFSLIVTYLLGVKTPQYEDNHADKSNSE